MTKRNGKFELVSKNCVNSSWVASWLQFKNIDISRSKPEELLTERGIDATIFDCIKDVPENRSKDNRFERLQLVRNMVNPEIGLHILKCAGW